LLKGQRLQDAVRYDALKNGLLVLLPLALLSWFFVWAWPHGLRPALAKDVLLAKYFHYVRAPEMIIIPGGEFWMGSENNDETDEHYENPRHKVRMAPFALAKYEVAFDEYQVFAYLINEQGGCSHTDQGGNQPTYAIAINDHGWGTGRCRAIHVSWEEAQCYVQWLNRLSDGSVYRLPSEAEWEYAARAGTEGDFFWGDGDADQYAWFAENSDRKTQPVGHPRIKPNPFGLYDMAGNVAEWVEDCWNDDYSDAPENGSAWRSEHGGDCVQRVARGGSWNFGPAFLRSAARVTFTPDARGSYLGFRLAQDLP
jgi:formylglycine-generating enzyme required for sulfatase activity